MKICYFDAFSGISGDMCVGALLDAGADWQQVSAALASLNLNASVHLERTKRAGIAAAKFRVEGGVQKAHRHLPQIEAIINGGDLPATARERALLVFRKLAEAESKSHAVPLERVHFHEVGAVDSICDIVGAAVALDSLHVGQLRTSKINVGSGTVRTEHGLLPVPAPATAELLRDWPVYAAGPEMELTTPTGAAIVSALAEQPGPLPSCKLLAQGFGAGDRDFPGHANVLRVLVGETTAASESTTVTVLEANIDDATPQVLGYALERLLDAGALDVTLSPVLMKKNRPATLLTVLTTPALADEMAAIVFAETTTLGLRLWQAERRVQARAHATVETHYGTVRIKYADGGAYAPEYEDCRRLAAEKAVPLREVLAEASRAFARIAHQHDFR